MNLAVSKLAPALICGNAVVLKPPQQGTVSGLHMAHCFHAAGLPAGVLNVCTGKGSEIGDYLTEHPLAKCISFTGGDTGLAVSKRAGMVPLQMELGGKDACIVLPDADLTLAISAVVKGGFSYSGQRCTAVKVVLVHESVADALVAGVNAGIAKLSVGQPEEDADICAVVSKSSADFIEGLVRDAEAKGARLHQPWRRQDNLIWPVLVDDVTEGMRIAWEEPFGARRTAGHNAAQRDRTQRSVEWHSGVLLAPAQAPPCQAPLQCVCVELCRWHCGSGLWAGPRDK